MSERTNLWVEKYRPKTLDNLILPPKTRKIVEDFGKDVPHLLLVGRPGTGKTTLAKILADDVLKCDYIYINASDENGVDTIREKVIGFAQTKSIDGERKIVILDECIDENTKVHILRDGKYLKIPIKDVDEKTDLVKSYSNKKDRIEYRPFEKQYMGEKDAYEITLENGDIVTCTGSHKWYVNHNGGKVKMTLDDIIKNDITEILSI